MSDLQAGSAAAPEDAAAVFLGFDFGMRRLGIAVGGRLTGRARALAVVPVHGGQPEWPQLDALLKEWKPAALVVGMPLSMDGSEQPMTAAARGFARALGRRSGLLVHHCDERLSSREAAEQFAAARRAGTRRRRHADDLDAMAAAVILETWLRDTSPSQSMQGRSEP